MPSKPKTKRVIASSGVPGLDDILQGGFTRDRLFVIEGMPGSGKTTLALQFLQAGAAAGEPVLYVTLSETEAELRSVADSHGWDLEGIEIREFSADGVLDPDEQNTIFHPSELELADTTRRMLEDVERIGARRLVLDSLSELRLLAGSALRYRRQILALKHLFAKRQVTVLLLDDTTSSDHDLQMQSIAHGVVMLETQHPDFGAERRRVRVIKYRGVKFRGGYHDYLILTGGLEVYPRLVAAEHRQAAHREFLKSGIAELDALLGGGIERGSSTLIVGAAGTGKSTLAAKFADCAALRGEKSMLFLFDEAQQTLIARGAELGMQLEKHADDGLIHLQQVDPAELTPGELTHAIQKGVEDGAKLVVLDSLNGYLNAMPEERHLTIQLHELLAYLSQRGVATLLIGAQHGLIGTAMSTPIDASYHADTVVMLRYFEARGEVRQALSVMKKRGSQHERTIREFKLERGEIRVGDVLRQFRGVLTGVPVYEGDTAPLLRSGERTEPPSGDRTRGSAAQQRGKKGSK
jgi:circadian clock protein KaiC